MNLRILVWVLVAGSLPAQEPPGRVGRLSYLFGTVSYRPEITDEWVSATVNDPIATGDHLWTDVDSQAEIQVGATAVHLAPQTACSVELLDDRVFRLRLTEGSLNLRIPRLNEGETVEVRTALAVFHFSRIGSYRMDASPGADFVSLTVWSGTATAVAGGKPIEVATGEGLTLSGNPVTADLADAPELNAWDEWCDSRDQLAERSLEASQEYVSWEIAGAEELSQYGDWESDDTYGICWRPRGLPSGWAPYRFGHWIYKAPWGWTWVDDAAWGFAPAHFGRWTRSRGAWAWIPDPRRHHVPYAPALVAFSGARGSPHVAWIPLGPGEELNKRPRAYRNRDAVTAAPATVFASSRPIAPARLKLFDRGTAEFSGRASDLAPTRESGRGGGIGRPAIGQRGPAERTVLVEPQRQESVLPERVGDSGRRLRQEREQTMRDERPQIGEGRQDEQRRAEESNRQEERRAEESRRQDEQRRLEESRQNEQRRVEANRLQEEQRRTDESRRQDEQRRLEESRQNEQRRVEANRRREEQRRADESRSQEEQRRAEESRRQEEQRRADANRRQEEQRRADESRRQEEQRRVEEGRRQDEQRRAEESRRQEEQRRAEEQRKQEAEARKK